MPVKELVMHPDLGLVERTVVESHSKIELPQLENEVTLNQAEVEQATAELTNSPVEAEVLVAAATKLAKAKVDLEDSKSNFETGTRLVAEQPNAGPEVAPENGTSEQATGEVAQPGPEF